MKSALVRFAPLALAFFLMIGCRSAQGYPKRPFDLEAEFKMLKPYHAVDILTVHDAKPAAEKKAHRNEVVNARIRAIDLRFGEFAQNLSRENNWTTLGLEWAVLGLSGAGTLVADAGTKSTLAALSGGFTGAKGSIDKNLFFNKTMPALLTQMEANRKVILTRIRTNLRDMDPADYPLTAALIDLDDYYNAGTLPGAIMSLTAESGRAASEAGEELNRVMTSQFLEDEAGRVLEAFLKPDGENVDGKNETTLRKWMDNNDLQSFSVPFFINSAMFKKQRPKAVEDLNLIPDN